MTYAGAPHSFFDRKQDQFAHASEDAWRRVLQRRPELLGRPPARNSVSALTDTEVRAAQVIEVADAQKWIAAERPLVIDLRSSFAYAALHIDGSVNVVDELFDELVAPGRRSAARPAAGLPGRRAVGALRRAAHPGSGIRRTQPRGRDHRVAGRGRAAGGD